MLVFKRRNPTPDRAPSSFDLLHARTYLFLKQHLGYQDARAIYDAGQRIVDLNERTLFYTEAVLQVEHRLSGQKPTVLRDFAAYKKQPVSIRQFICDPYFLGKEQEIYPVVLAAAEELNNGTYVEAVLTGGIGSGKTTLALYTNAYQLYLLSCMRNPHRLFNLDPSSEILLIFQSITKTLAKGVDYQRFRSMIEESPYFKNEFPFDPRLESELQFPHRIGVKPVSGSETAAIGQNVMGGMIDELNYMAIVEKSRAAVDKGSYDQAVNIYNSIARRRKSRFMENGRLPGILCLVSSKKYPGQFTDQKMAEAEKDPTIYVYDKRVWDIKPDDFGHNGYFRVFMGDLTRKPRVLADDEEVNDYDRSHLLVSVPSEFKTEFEKDVINALREIAGCSTLARHPFFLEVDKVNEAFRVEHASIFSRTPVDFVTTHTKLMKGALYKPHLPRFVHVDLALSNDHAGLTIGTVTGFRDVSVDPKSPAFMPEFWIDGTLEIYPPRNSEIQFSKIREVLFVLKRMGMAIHWVTFDQFQSSDSQQILRQWGLLTGHQSVDDVPCRPYDFLKTAIYEGRVNMPVNEHLQKEMLMLEKDTKTSKVDHPPGGSKDCADSLAAVVYGLTMRRDIWGLYRIATAAIPLSVLKDTDKLTKKNEQAAATRRQMQTVQEG